MTTPLEDRQAEMKARHKKGATKKKLEEHHGKCWSKFGTSNPDAHSPFQGSIPQWGFKIKVRSKPE
jgi:hypothetical protein